MWMENLETYDSESKLSSRYQLGEASLGPASRLSDYGDDASTLFLLFYAYYTISNYS